MNEEKNNSEETKESSPEEIIVRLEKEKQEYLDGWKRAKADLINYRKDELKRFEEIARFGTEDVMLDLTLILDSFDLAMRSGTAESNEGVRMIKTQLMDILKRRGLERIPIKKGDEFNPTLHEAVAESEEDEAPGKITEELSAGYMLNGRVIRPARVKVAK
ncbi:MAG: nucleotide exchange factor GrpE [Candidatus Colwellbacteria bacterium RIFCSPLOWO2_12_FULL_44_13]|uniref:Protein GrpE n=3 Tax=Candidatus Colwelliibacteriota TaxID=1817904 RepID=A0A1G1Z5E1_9BACT|nr:MAG: nucleotide exchange factor GrpE [Candidatus Colwellbacteria bacterium RIFCSPHIGHO2_12_FULL_44_17]OGY59825.1 MAG: nucleotide exchange factor GrpE [Candidatus Colwellbacteria bacterium RIFCSPLOWO2_02_FULL_44_20b]OGY61550.1 MAG: nucleotide exchange factor GrpE [Candidatus Colwellbacteria bacterium RIFCSPLOWO2_12_FULL_44_13]